MIKMIKVTLMMMLVPMFAFASNSNIDNVSNNNNLSTLILWLLFFGFLTILASGLVNKVVIFYDELDLYISFAPWIFLAVFGLIAHSFDEGFIRSAITWIFVYTVPVILVLISIYLSITYNRSVLIGLIVGPFKLLFSLLGIISFFHSILTWFGDESSYKDMIIASIILSITGWLTVKLINGESVYIKKGWLIPQEDSSQNTEATY